MTWQYTGDNIWTLKDEKRTYGWVQAVVQEDGVAIKFNATLDDGESWIRLGDRPTLDEAKHLVDERQVKLIDPQSGKVYT